MSALAAPMHRDSVLRIDCDGTPLVGLLSEPVTAPARGADAGTADEQGNAVKGGHAGKAGDTGVLLIVGGPQYRVGSHRQFTLLGRALAVSGVPCLRLDYRGMGDAGGDQRGFEQVDADIAAALDAWMRERPALRRVVLWGLCDAASAALLYVHRQRDARVAGLCLANPWVRTEASLARTQVRHYYLERLRQPAFWRKLLSGRVGLSAVRELLGKLAQSRATSSGSATGAAAGQPGASAGKARDGHHDKRNDTRHYTEQMADGLRAFRGPVLLVLSGDDYVAKEFLDRCRDGGAAWRGLLDRPGLRREDLPEADHTFSTAAWRARVEQLTAAFARGVAAGGSPTP